MISSIASVYRYLEKVAAAMLFILWDYNLFSGPTIIISALTEGRDWFRLTK